MIGKNVAEAKIAPSRWAAPARAVPETSGEPIWDLPVRLCHWLIVGLIGLAWWTAETRHLDWHRWCGYALLTLLLFRFGWGVFGSRPARFATFVKGPVTILAYLKGHYRHSPEAGHNPLGGWSVVTLLSTLLTQVLLGFFAVDIDGLDSGPFSWMVNFETGRWAAQTHAVVFDALLILIVFHIAAVVYHVTLRREPLLRRMVIGTVSRQAGEVASVAGPVRALIFLLVSAGAVYVLISTLGR